MITFQVSQSQENLTSHAGLALIGAALNRTGLAQKLNQFDLPKAKQEPDISHSEVIYSYIGLLGLGQSDYEAIEPFREDEWGFKAPLNLEGVPSSATLRQRLDQLASMPDRSALLMLLKEESLALLKERQAVLSPTLRDLVPLDIDVSPFDNSKSHKEEVSRTYKGFDGYAPILAYLGLEGYMTNVELRPGKQHCQNGTPSFLSETLTLTRQLTRDPLLVRLDAGNDAGDNLSILLAAEGVDFVIKRNLRKESKETWLERAKQRTQAQEVRPGKLLYQGDIFLPKTLTLHGQEKRCWLRCVFEVTERTIKADGQHLLLPDIEVETYWTSLTDPVTVVIGQYHPHATSEQYHAEFKGEIDLERLPSGKFKTNHLVLHCALVAYNTLRLIGQIANEGQALPLPKTAGRRRIKTVIQNLIYLAARV
ncbi:MAG: IS1380 family transposase, partial [Candidatus Brocadiales bacterium]|nr:IS1380 family transposase [Candidatus Bathyanammoxibius sp.]